VLCAGAIYNASACVPVGLRSELSVTIQEDVNGEDNAARTNAFPNRVPSSASPVRDYHHGDDPVSDDFIQHLLRCSSKGVDVRALFAMLMHLLSWCSNAAVGGARL